MKNKMGKLLVYNTGSPLGKRLWESDTDNKYAMVSDNEFRVSNTNNIYPIAMKMLHRRHSFEIRVTVNL